jgi:RNA exonuclease 4
MDKKNKSRHTKGKSSHKRKSSSSSSSNSSTKKTGSNWAALKKKQKTTGSDVSKKRGRSTHPNSRGNGDKVWDRRNDRRSGAQKRKGVPRTDINATGTGAGADTGNGNDHHLYVACDCEMVGVGAADRSELARVSLTNWTGQTLYDKFVKPRGKVTNYRTWVSGIRKRDLIDAMPFQRAQKEVQDLLRGKILVGHALDNDLKSLDLDHPENMIRDTARYPPLLKRNAATGKRQPRKLKDLSAQIGNIIQKGSHSSVEDAIASMRVYQHHKEKWDKWLETGQLPDTVKFTTLLDSGSKKRKTKGADPFASKSKRKRLLENQTKMISPGQQTRQSGEKKH